MDLTMDEVQNVEPSELIGKKLLFDMVLSGGDIGNHVLSFLPGKKGKLWTYGNSAARFGHLHLVKWLWKKGEKCTLVGANLAAGNGHLHILKWLSHVAIEEVSNVKSHVQLKRFYKVQTAIQQLGAQWIGRNGVSIFEIQRYVTEYYEDKSFDDNFVVRLCLLQAENNGWVVKQQPNRYSLTAKGNLLGLQLVEKVHPTVEGLQRAVQQCHTHVVKWLHHNGLRLETADRVADTGNPLPLPASPPPSVCVCVCVSVCVCPTPLHLPLLLFLFLLAPPPTPTPTSTA